MVRVRIQWVGSVRHGRDLRHGQMVWRDLLVDFLPIRIRAYVPGYERLVKTVLEIAYTVVVRLAAVNT